MEEVKQDILDLTSEKIVDNSTNILEIIINTKQFNQEQKEELISNLVDKLVELSISSETASEIFNWFVLYININANSYAENTRYVDYLKSKISEKIKEEENKSEPKTLIEEINDIDYMSMSLETIKSFVQRIKGMDANTEEESNILGDSYNALLKKVCKNIEDELHKNDNLTEERINLHLNIIRYLINKDNLNDLFIKINENKKPEIAESYTTLQKKYIELDELIKISKKPSLNNIRDVVKKCRESNDFNDECWKELASLAINNEDLEVLLYELQNEKQKEIKFIINEGLKERNRLSEELNTDLLEETDKYNSIDLEEDTKKKIRSVVTSLNEQEHKEVQIEAIDGEKKEIDKINEKIEELKQGNNNGNINVDSLINEKLQEKKNFIESNNTSIDKKNREIYQAKKKLKEDTNLSDEERNQLEDKLSILKEERKNLIDTKKAKLVEIEDRLRNGYELKDKKDLLDKYRDLTKAYYQAIDFAVKELKNQEDFNSLEEQDQNQRIVSAIPTELMQTIMTYPNENIIKELMEDVKKRLKKKEEKKEENIEKLWRKALVGAVGFAHGFATAYTVVPGVGQIITAVAFLKLLGSAYNFYTKKTKKNEDGTPKYPDGKITAITNKIIEDNREKHPKIIAAVDKIRKITKSEYFKWYTNGFSAGYMAANLFGPHHAKQAANTQTQTPATKTNTTPTKTNTTPTQTATSVPKTQPILTSKPVSVPKPVQVDPNDVFGKSFDLSELSGYKAEGSNKAYHLIKSIAKHASPQKAVIENGETWIHFVSPDGNLAWEPLSKLNEAGISFSKEELEVLFDAAKTAAKIR